MAKSENVVSEDGQYVEVKYPGESLQDQAARERAEAGEVPVGTMTAGAPSDVDEDLLEVREIREQNERRAGLHNRTEIHREIVAGSRSSDAKAKPVEIHVFGGRMYVNTHGEAVLDREGVISLRAACESAFQAVS